MRNEYFESDEFKSVLDKYEASEKHGKSCYFDAEDFVDIADFYLLNERPDDAIKVVEVGLELHPDDDELLTTKSATLIFVHQYEQAREVLDLVTDQEDNNVLYQRAQLKYCLEHDTDTAEEMFVEWISNEEEQMKITHDEDTEFRIRDAYLHVITSFVELSDGRYDEELVKRWIEEYYARFSPLGSNDCDLILGDLVRNEGMSDMVEKIYSSLLEYDPYINFGWTVLGVAQMLNGKCHEAIESADFALAIDPNNADSILTKAHAHYTLGQKNIALEYFEKYLTIFDDPAQYLPYSICLITNDRVEEAKVYLSKCEEYVLLNDDQKDYQAQANFEMSEAYFAIEEIEKAMKCIDRSLAIYPNDSQFLLHKATIHLVKEDFQECLENFTKCIVEADDKVWATANVAYRFILQNQSQIALQILETVTPDQDCFPYYRCISAYKALAYSNTDQTEEFLTHLKQACEECPDTLKFLFWDKFPETVNPKDYYTYLINNPL